MMGMGMMVPKHPLTHHAAIGKRTNHTVVDDKQNGEKREKPGRVNMPCLPVVLRCVVHGVVHGVCTLFLFFTAGRAAAGDRKSVLPCTRLPLPPPPLATSAPIHAVLSAWPGRERCKIVVVALSATYSATK